MMKSISVVLVVVAFFMTFTASANELQQVQQSDATKNYQELLQPEQVMPTKPLSIVGDEAILDSLVPKEKQIQPLRVRPVVDFLDTCKEYNMLDKTPLTGFVDDWGFCTPGLVTTEVWFTKSPQYVYGTAVFYSPGMMKATAVWRQMYPTVYGRDSEYLGGVATPSPADIGETVWLRRDGHKWEGPYLVVDCSRRADMYTHIAINQQVVEVDFNTAVRWGLAYYTNDWWGYSQSKESPVEVYYGTTKPSESIREYRQPIFYSSYWLRFVADFQRDKIEPRPVITKMGLNPVWNFMDGSEPKCYTTACSQE